MYQLLRLKRALKAILQERMSCLGSIFNDAHKIGLLCGAGTCFATLHQLLRLKRELNATKHSAAFQSVSKNKQVVLAIEDIENEVFRKGIFCSLRAFF